MLKVKHFLAGVFILACIAAFLPSATALTEKTVDCSVPSTKECVKINIPGEDTIIHYGKAKPAGPVQP